MDWFVFLLSLEKEEEEVVVVFEEVVVDGVVDWELAFDDLGAIVVKTPRLMEVLKTFSGIRGWLDVVEEDMKLQEGLYAKRSC